MPRNIPSLRAGTIRRANDKSLPLGEQCARRVRGSSAGVSGAHTHAPAERGVAAFARLLERCAEHRTERFDLERAGECVAAAAVAGYLEPGMSRVGERLPLRVDVDAGVERGTELLARKAEVPPKPLASVARHD